ncbi:GL13101 [Drosophila persimilis]|uniref:GL13101 n=2 Tax=Drosophila persimilis TaxID=7234 RepID=B4GV59_DROPE|nr:GL13101 [Drosophila persimilis]
MEMENTKNKPHRSEKILGFLDYLQATQRLKFWKPHPNRSKVVKYICLSAVSCDMDSVISTLAVAYYRYRTKQSTFDHYVPMLNMRRRDFAANKEVDQLLRKWNIDEARHLLFRDDFKIEILMQCRFILVNHHDSCFNNLVVEFYDHRPFRFSEAPLPRDCQCDLSILPMHSCAGMITALYKKASMESNIVFELLHTALLMANSNFVMVPPNTLGDVPDFRMLKHLETLIRDKAMEPEERANAYQKTTDSVSKSGVLSLPEIIRRKFKLLQTSNGKVMRDVLFTSFPMALSTLVTFSQAPQVIDTFGKEQAADFILMLSTTPGTEVYGPRPVYQLGLLPMDGLQDRNSRRLFEHIVVNLNLSVDPMLKLKPFSKCDFMHGAFYNLGKLDNTVPDVLHLVERILYHWAEKCRCVTVADKKKPCF